MKAVIYSRVSTDSQETERQVIECKNLCNALKYEVLDIIEETGSGFKNDRPGLDKVLRHVEKNEVDVVVTYELSRLGRNNDVLKTIETFDQHKVSLHTILYNIRTNPTEGSSFTNPFIGILVALSHSEAAIFKQRSSSGLKKIAMDGKALGSTNYPYGYCKKELKGYLEIDETEAQVVKDVFKLYLEGKGTLQIKNILNELKVPTRNNKRWAEAVVYSMLNNTMYIGKRPFKGETFDLPQFRIVDDETFYEVQKRLRNNYSKLGKHIKHNYLIDRTKTKIICGVCGKTYYAHKRSDGKDNRYICISTRYQESCGNYGISIPKLEKAVQLVIIKHFSNILLSKLDNKSIKEEIERKTELIERLEKDADKLLKTQTNLIKDRYAGLIPEDAYTVVMNDLNKQRDDNKLLIQQNNDKLIELKQTYDNILDLKKLEKQINENVNIPSDKINKIIKKLTITKEEQPHPRFKKPYDKVVKVNLVAGKEGNQVSFQISQREDFMYDYSLNRIVKLHIK
jgi:site-specific DNA recombinase